MCDKWLPFCGGTGSLSIFPITICYRAWNPETFQLRGHSANCWVTVPSLNQKRSFKFKATLQPVLLLVFWSTFFFKQRMGVWLIVRCNSLPWQPDCFVFQPSLDEFTVPIRPQMREELAQHTDSLSLALFFNRLLLARRPSGCCCRTEEPHSARRPQRTGGRIDMLLRSAVWYIQFRDLFGGAPVHQHRPLSAPQPPSTDTAPGCTDIPLFISLTGLFSCFLLAESCALPGVDRLQTSGIGCFPLINLQEEETVKKRASERDSQCVNSAGMCVITALIAPVHRTHKCHCENKHTKLRWRKLKNKMKTLS